MLRDLMEKAHNMQEQIDHVAREMKILRNIKKRNARDQKHCNRKEECLQLISRLDTAKKRISVLEDMTTETSKTEK